MGHREMRAFAVCFTLSSLSALGCGGSSAPADPPHPSAQAPIDGERLARVYAAFGYGNCLTGSDCPRVFAKAAGVDLGADGRAAAANPRSSMRNPDPEWLLEWDRLPTSEAGAHYAYEALALAAVRRSWTKACDDAYRAHRARVDAELATLDKAIAERNRDPNPYDRLGGLLALAPAAPKKGALGEFVPGSDAVRHRFETAVFDAFEDTARTFVYVFDAHAPSDELLAVLRPRQAEAYERDAFCADASSGGIEGVPRLPDTSAWDKEVRAMVRAAIPEERLAAVAKRRAELTAQTQLKFAKAKLPNPQLPSGLRELQVASVHTFERDGKRAIVTSVVTREERSGAKTVKIDETVISTFPDWPSGVVLAPGDSVSFYGAEVKVKDTVIRSTPELEHLSRQTSLEAKHVTRLTAKGVTKKYFR